MTWLGKSFPFAIHGFDVAIHGSILKISQYPLVFKISHNGRIHEKTLPLFSRLAKMALTETYDNSGHFDVVFSLFVWLAFVPTCTTPCLLFIWFLSRWVYMKSPRLYFLRRKLPRLHFPTPEFGGHTTKEVYANRTETRGVLTCFGCEIKTFWYFIKVDQCSAISMESARRDLLKGMAEHRATLKNNQNTQHSLIFLDRPMFSHINGKLSPRPFEWYGLT